MTDRQFMTWIHDRLVNHYRVDRQSDYMIKFRAIVATIPDPQVTPAVEPVAKEKPVDDGKTIFSLDQDLTFGKYKGETLEDVIDENPGYVHWALDNVEFFAINKEAEEYLGEEE